MNLLYYHSLINKKDHGQNIANRSPLQSEPIVYILYYNNI